jgi:hypothetical protein
MHPSFEDSLPSGAQALVELFRTELAGVKFPEVDGPGLEIAVEQVREQAAAVSQAEQALEEARSALGARVEALVHKGQRALAYARIYLEERPELAERLEAISWPRLARKARGEPGKSPSDELSPPVRRRRNPKAKQTESLFVEAPAEVGPKEAGLSA